MSAPYINMLKEMQNEISHDSGWRCPQNQKLVFEGLVSGRDIFKSLAGLAMFSATLSDDLLKAPLKIKERPYAG